MYLSSLFIIQEKLTLKNIGEEMRIEVKLSGFAVAYRCLFFVVSRCVSVCVCIITHMMMRVYAVIIQKT